LHSDAGNLLFEKNDENSLSISTSPAKTIFLCQYGQKNIAKIVEYIPLTENFMNLSFGDLRPDGSVDDSIPSNNGDIIKVLATVVDILKHYTAQHPETGIFFYRKYS